METADILIDTASDRRPDDLAVVDIEEFQDARRDPVVNDFLEFASSYGERLEREGRNL